MRTKTDKTFKHNEKKSFAFISCTRCQRIQIKKNSLTKQQNSAIIYCDGKSFFEHLVQIIEMAPE